MNDFMRAAVSLPGKPRIARAPMGAEIIIHATAAETGGVYGVWETIVPPGMGPEPHTHSRETECFRVLEGVFHFRCGDQEFGAPPGSVVVLPPHVEHHWWNTSDHVGRVMGFVTPGGFEQLFIDIEVTQADTPEKIARLEAAVGLTNAETRKLGLAKA